MKLLTKISLCVLILVYVFSPFHAYAALTDDLAGYWKFDESSGDAMDSHNTNDLTNNGVDYVSAKLNNGASGNSATYLSGSFSSSGTALTGSIWVKLTSNSQSGVYVLSKRNAGNNANYGVVFYSGIPRIISWNGSDYYEVQGSQTFSVGVWYHLVAVFDGANSKLYVNGIEENVGTLSSLVAGDEFTVLSGYSGAGALSGVVDELALYDRALTSGEVTTLYNSGEPLPYPLSGEEPPEEPDPTGTTTPLWDYIPTNALDFNDLVLFLIAPIVSLVIYVMFKMFSHFKF